MPDASGPAMGACCSTTFVVVVLVVLVLVVVVSSVVISMIGRLSHNLELLLLGGAGSENALELKPPASSVLVRIPDRQDKIGYKPPSYLRVVLLLLYFEGRSERFDRLF